MPAKKIASRKIGQRGPGRIQRSKSGGSVKGKIPHPGGSNKTNHETGVNVTRYGTKKKPVKRVTTAPKKTQRKR
jgi:hypothetical protein